MKVSRQESTLLTRKITINLYLCNYATAHAATWQRKFWGRGIAVSEISPLEIISMSTVIVVLTGDTLQGRREIESKWRSWHVKSVCRPEKYQGSWE